MFNLTSLFGFGRNNQPEPNAYRIGRWEREASLVTIPQEKLPDSAKGRNAALSRLTGEELGAVVRNYFNAGDDGLEGLSRVLNEGRSAPDAILAGAVRFCAQNGVPNILMRSWQQELVRRLPKSIERIKRETPDVIRFALADICEQARDQFSAKDQASLSNIEKLAISHFDTRAKELRSESWYEKPEKQVRALGREYLRMFRYSTTLPHQASLVGSLFIYEGSLNSHYSLVKDAFEGELPKKREVIKSAMRRSFPGNFAPDPQEVKS